MNITSGKIESAQKVLVYGPEGVGKSTFAAQFPDALFIDTEGSTKHLDVKRLDTPTSWQMLLAEVAEVKANPTVCKTLVIDTLDWAEQLCIEQICSKNRWSGIEDAGYGKGYTYLAEEFGRLLNQLSDLVAIGINVVLTAHAQIKKFEQPDELGAYDRWELKLQRKTAPLCKEWADMILFANYETIVVTGKDKKAKGQGGSKRVMYTQHTSAWDAKNRHGLADKLPFDYANIASAIPTGAVVPTATTSTVAAVPNTQTPAVAAVPTATPNVAAQPMTQPTSTATPVPVAVPTAPVPVAVPTAPAAVTTPSAVTTQAAATVTPEVTIYDDTAAHGGSPPPLHTENLKFEPVYADYFKPLLDLMEQAKVNDLQVRQVAADRQYQVYDTPMCNWPQDFVEGWAIACWPQIKEAIYKNSPYSTEIPFSV